MRYLLDKSNYNNIYKPTCLCATCMKIVPRKHLHEWRSPTSTELLNEQVRIKQRQTLIDQTREAYKWVYWCATCGNLMAIDLAGNEFCRDSAKHPVQTYNRGLANFIIFIFFVAFLPTAALGLRLIGVI